MNIELTEQEVNDIITVLGQLPTSTGAFPLLCKISEQAKAQMPPPEPAAPE